MMNRICRSAVICSIFLLPASVSVANAPNKPLPVKSLETGRHTITQPAPVNTLRQTSLIGNWKLVKATVTPDFLKIPIPLLSCSATGQLQKDNSYRINALASFFGRNYHYKGSGKAAITGNKVILTINEGVTTVDGEKKTIDRRGKMINGTYKVVNKTLHVTADKYSKGVRYTFKLQLVNS